MVSKTSYLPMKIYNNAANSYEEYTKKMSSNNIRQPADSMPSDLIITILSNQSLQQLEANIRQITFAVGIAEGYLKSLKYLRTLVIRANENIFHPSLGVAKIYTKDAEAFIQRIISELSSNFNNGMINMNMYGGINGASPVRYNNLLEMASNVVITNGEVTGFTNSYYVGSYHPYVLSSPKNSIESLTADNDIFRTILVGLAYALISVQPGDAYALISQETVNQEKIWFNQASMKLGEKMVEYIQFVKNCYDESNYIASTIGDVKVYVAKNNRQDLMLLATQLSNVQKTQDLMQEIIKKNSNGIEA